MRCEYFERGEVELCKAVLQGIKVPTAIEKATSCLTEHYDACPIYRKVQRVSDKRRPTKQ